MRNEVGQGFSLAIGARAEYSEGIKRREAGIALVVCLLAMSLLMALGAALVLATSAETLIAGNFRAARECRYAAAAALERAMADLSSVPDWSLIFAGRAQSGFIDGPPAGARPLADGTSLDLTQVVNRANCGQVAACTDRQMNAVTAERPWGSNNPRWQLYAYGPLDSLLDPGVITSRQYVIVLAADDQAEIDGNPVIDGSEGDEAGHGILVLRAESFGPRGAHRLIEATIARGSPAVRLLSWREG